MTATAGRSLVIQASFAVAAPAATARAGTAPTPGAAVTAGPGAAGRGGIASLASVLRGPRPDLLPPARGSGGPARGGPASAPAQAGPGVAGRGGVASPASVLRGPRPDLLPPARGSGGPARSGPAGEPPQAGPGVAGRGGVASPASVLRGPRPDLLPPARGSGGPARHGASSVQPAVAAVRPASAMDAMRARAPRPELMPAGPAAVQRAVAAGRPGPARAASTLLGPQILQLQPGGQPLPGAVRQRMESLLGADLSEVRIHQGAQPAAIGAVAFTAGAHIYFAPGHYRPTEPAGQRLLARQLTYVLQQRAGLARNPHGRGVALVRDPELDAQAEQLGELASRPGVMQAKALPAARGLFQIKTSMAGPGRQHLELYERGRAVGGADVVLEGPRAKLYNLRVDAEHRGRGGGEQLMHAAAVASERMGRTTLALEADDDGSGKLVRWYQSQGFRSAGKGDRGQPAFEASVRALKKP